MYANLMRPAQNEARLSKVVRMFHRWTSCLFVLSVIAAAIALAQAEPVMWMSYLPLAPLAVLALTGIFMLLQPYAARWRDGRAC
jgi:ABC-type polysaccharide/polyol phosphate export permease